MSLTKEKVETKPVIKVETKLTEVDNKNPIRPFNETFTLTFGEIAEKVNQTAGIISITNIGDIHIRASHKCWRCTMRVNGINFRIIIRFWVFPPVYATHTVAGTCVGIH